MKKWKWLLSIGMACFLLAGCQPAKIHSEKTDSKQSAVSAKKQKHIFTKEKLSYSGKALSEKKIKKTQGWFQQGKYRQYYSDGDCVRGLKVIQGKLYDFGKYGFQKTGLVEIGGFFYDLEKNGAICGQEKQIQGKKLYFSEQGRGFYATGNTRTDAALGNLFDQMTLPDRLHTRKSLEYAYRYLLSCVGYLGIGKPSFRSGWEYIGAANMLLQKQGNCYSYATACGMMARAMGFQTEIIAGKCQKTGKTYSDHCWCLLEKKYVMDAVYEDVDDHGRGRLSYFLKTYSALKKEKHCAYRMTGSTP